MLAYIIRRLLYAIPILLGVNLITFGLFFFTISPDAIARRMLGEKNIKPEQIEDWKREHGYHLPRLINTQSTLSLNKGKEISGWLQEVDGTGFDLITANGHNQVVMKDKATFVANPEGPPKVTVSLKKGGPPISGTMKTFSADSITYTSMQPAEQTIAPSNITSFDAKITLKPAGKDTNPKGLPEVSEVVQGKVTSLSKDSITLLIPPPPVPPAPSDLPEGEEPPPPPQPTSRTLDFKQIAKKELTFKAQKEIEEKLPKGYELSSFDPKKGATISFQEPKDATLPLTDIALLESGRGMILGSIQVQGQEEELKLLSLKPFQGPHILVEATNGDRRAVAKADVKATEGTGLAKMFTETIFWKKSMRLFVFDFGKSDRNNVDIGYQIKQRAPASLLIALPTFIVGLLVNLFISMIVAYCRGTYLDFWGVFIAIVLMAISILFYIMFGQYLISRILHLLPISGYDTGQHAIKFLVMPVVIGVIAGIGNGVRFYRTVFLDELNRDYIRTARSKGLSEEGVLFKHALRNALIPILTGVVVVLPVLFMGSLVMEAFFAIPGLGSFTFDAITSGDFAIVRSMVFLSAFLYLGGLIMTDISYTIADPRIRLD